MMTGANDISMAVEIVDWTCRGMSRKTRGHREGRANVHRRGAHVDSSSASLEGYCLSATIVFLTA